MTSEIEIYKEKIKIFDLKNNFKRYENKSEFYKSLREEYAKKGYATRKVHTVRLFLLNREGQIYLSRRSRIKKENSLLFDKTIGAHIRKNESPEYTVLRESEEELGFPAVTLEKDDFSEAIKESDFTRFAILKKIETIYDFNAIYRYRNTDKTTVFPQITTIFIGVYDGAIKFEDAETDIIELFDLEHLSKDLKDNPEKYTDDLRILIPRYRKELKELIRQLKSQTQ